MGGQEGDPDSCCMGGRLENVLMQCCWEDGECINEEFWVLGSSFWLECNAS